MNGRSKLGAVVVASMIVLFAGQVALAQVEWTWDQVVVPPGDPGTWDSGRHNPGDVVFDGTTYHMYLMGGPGFTPIEDSWSVGHWTSDAVTGPWVPDDDHNPVLVPEPGQWDGYSVGGAVLYDGAMFHIWYASAAAHLDPCYVGHATSADGSSWTKDLAHNPLVGLGPGAPGAWDDYGTTPKTVLVEGSSLRMWYFAFQGGYLGGTWRIGHARSTDGGYSWTKDPDPVLEASEPWEGNKVYSPTVVRYGDRFAMWYTGYNGVTAALGYATSPDGLVWTKEPTNPVLTPVGCNTVDSSEVILQGHTAHGWVSNCYDVWHVTSTLELFFDDFETSTTDAWSFTMP